MNLDLAGDEGGKAGILAVRRLRLCPRGRSARPLCPRNVLAKRYDGARNQLRLGASHAHNAKMITISADPSKAPTRAATILLGPWGV